MVHGSLRVLAKHFLCSDEGGGLEPGHLLCEKVCISQGAEDRQRRTVGENLITMTFVTIH